jgi:hypothetical protein
MRPWVSESTVGERWKAVLNSCMIASASACRSFEEPTGGSGALLSGFALELAEALSSKEDVEFDSTVDCTATSFEIDSGRSLGPERAAACVCAACACACACASSAFADGWAPPCSIAMAEAADSWRANERGVVTAASSVASTTGTGVATVSCSTAKAARISAARASGFSGCSVRTVCKAFVKAFSSAVRCRAAYCCPLAALASGKLIVRRERERGPFCRVTQISPVARRNPSIYSAPRAHIALCFCPKRHRPRCRNKNIEPCHLYVCGHHESKPYFFPSLPVCRGCDAVVMASGCVYRHTYTCTLYMGL